MLHFDLNLSILLTDSPFLERVDRAAQLGFGAVEFWWPAEADLQALPRRIRDAGLQTALFNLDGGDLAAGERGLLNDPAREQRFRDNLPRALELAYQLGCMRLHALVGCWRDDEPREAQLARVHENLAWICAQAAPAGITILVEALNTYDTPGYMVPDTGAALALIERVGAANLALQYDTYHLQRMGDLDSARLPALCDRIGHIQVADLPGRGAPGSGDLPFPAFFAAVVAAGYQGWIGLEYQAAAGGDPFGWLPPDRRGALVPGALRL
jgi:hydroxypyruvate isomerase